MNLCRGHATLESLAPRQVQGTCSPADSRQLGDLNILWGHWLTLAQVRKLWEPWDAHTREQYIWTVPCLGVIALTLWRAESLHSPFTCTCICPTSDRTYCGACPPPIGLSRAAVILHSLLGITRTTICARAGHSEYPVFASMYVIHP